jgi:hypothetical protein
MYDSDTYLLIVVKKLPSAGQAGQVVTDQIFMVD